MNVQGAGNQLYNLVIHAQRPYLRPGRNPQNRSSFQPPGPGLDPSLPEYIHRIGYSFFCSTLLAQL